MLFELRAVSVVDKKSQKKLFHPVDLALDNENAMIIGKSGVGKSTLLSAILGSLDKQVFGLQGEILLSGKNITALAIEKREVAMVMQQSLLFPHFSVFENLSFATHKHPQNNALIDDILKNNDFFALKDRFPDEISGGQKARICVLQALLSQPKLLLLDEPFEGLDQKMRQDFKTFVFNICKQFQTHFLLVSHHQSDGIGIKKRLIIKND